jgi:hypothetical protein
MEEKLFDIIVKRCKFFFSVIFSVVLEISGPCNKNCVNGHKVILYRRRTNGQQKTKGKG